MRLVPVDFRLTFARYISRINPGRDLHCHTTTPPYDQPTATRLEGDRMSLDDLKERTKAIDLAVVQIEKQFGKGSIMRLGQRNPLTVIDSISTGSISIDYALGIGGVPRGRVIEIFGPESSG